MNTKVSKKLPLLSIRWITCTCFEIKTPQGFTIVTDPYIGAAKATDATVDIIEGADLVLITHTHYDHITDVGALIDKFNSKVLVGELSGIAFTKWLNCNPTNIYPVTPNLTLDFNDVKVTALYGRHSDPKTPLMDRINLIRTRPIVDERMLETQWFGTMEYRNYLITLPSGFKVLLWGSNDSPEQRAIIRELKPDLAIMQMTRIKPEILAEMAAEADVKILIPHHMDTSKSPEEYEPLVEQLGIEFSKRNPFGTVISPKHNKWFDISINIEGREENVF